MIINDATEEIYRLRELFNLATTEENEAELSEQLNTVVHTTNQRAARAKQLLTTMREATDQMQSDAQRHENTSSSSELRVRENMCNTLTRKFVNVMQAYQESQQEYKVAIKKKVTRQVQIVKPEATTEDVDAVLKSGKNVGEVFKSAILNNTADPIQSAFQHAADKYQDVLRLEQSVTELHQMFLDFALLTEQQGELLDQIEHNVKTAADYIEQGNEDMIESINSAKSIMKIKIILAVIVVIVLIVILAVSGAFKSNNSKK